MSAPPCEHPALSDLQAFGLGQLDPARSGAVEDHVARCDACCDDLQKAADDSLVKLLREAATLADPTPPPDGVWKAATLTPPAPGADATGEWRPDDGPPPELAAHPRYRILRLLGAGGMGAVYLAEHDVMRRPVALKVINRTFTANPAAVERFRREIRAAARLQHPHIVAAYDAEQAGETHFLVMEYVEGVSLDRLVRERGPLPVAEACAYARQAALGLQHAHEKGLTHRDIKPHNLIRTADGTVKVLDFGLAAVAAEPGDRALTTVTNVVMGTPDFIAPEQAENTHAADARSDVYSLGCTLYYLLTGRPPFPRPSTLLTLLAHREESPPPLAAARPDAPAGLAAVLDRMTAKAPADRYPTAAEVAAALTPFVDQGHGPSAGGAERLRKAVPSRWPPPRRRLLVAVAAAAVFVGVLAAAAVVVRIRTDQGEVTIQTDDPNIEVVVKKGGKLVRIVDPQSGQKWELDPERYQIGMADQPDGLTIELDGKEPFTLKSKGGKLVTITREPERAAGKPPAAEGAGEVRRIVWSGHRITDGMLSFSPDGHSLLAAATSDEGRVWDLDSGKPRFDFNGSIARYLPSGEQIVVADQEGSLKMIDAAQGGAVCGLAPSSGTLNVCVSPNGRYLFTVKSTSLSRWLKWSDKEWRWIDNTESSDRSLNAQTPLSFTADGEYLVVVPGGRPPCLVIRCQDGTLMAPHTFSPLRKKAGIVQQLSPDGRLLFQRDGRDLQALDVETGEEVGRTRLEEEGPRLVTFALSRDGERLLAAYEDGSLRLVERETGKELARFDMTPAVPRVVCFSRDGRRAAAAGYDGTIVVWRLPGPPAEEPPAAREGAEAQRFVWPVKLSDGQLSFSPDGRSLLAFSYVSKGRVWDVASGEVRFEVDGYVGRYTPDGKEILTGTHHNLRLYHAASRGQLLREIASVKEGLWNLVLSPDGKTFLTAGPDGWRLWNRAGGEPLKRWDCDAAKASLVYTPDGKYLLTASDDKEPYKVWDVAAGKEVDLFPKLREGPVRVSAFTADGRQAIVGDSVVEVSTGKVVRRIAPDTTKFAGYPVVARAYSRDCRRELVAYDNGVVRLRDLQSGDELARFEMKTAVARMVCLSDDGRYAAAAAQVGTVVVWRLPDPPADKPGEAP
jgi:WD40 repeat protein